MSTNPSPLQLFMTDFLRGENECPVICDDNARVHDVQRDNNHHHHYHNFDSYRNKIAVDDNENDDNSWNDEEDYLAVCGRSYNNSYNSIYYNNKYKFNYTSRCNPFEDNDEFTVCSSVSSLSSCSLMSASDASHGSSRNNRDSRWDSGSLSSVQALPLVPRRRYDNNKTKHDLHDPTSFPFVVGQLQSAPSLPRRPCRNTDSCGVKNSSVIKDSSCMRGYNAKIRNVQQQEEAQADPVRLLYLNKDTTPQVRKPFTTKSKKTSKSGNAVVCEILDAAMRGILLDDHDW